MDRRKFIKIGFGAFLAAAASLLLLDFPATVRRMLQEDSSRLGLGDEAIDLFLTEATKEHFWDQFSFAKKAFISFQHTLLYFGIRTPYYLKYLHYRNRITGQFLFSTDLFIILPGQKVTYTRFHNPFQAPCSNPFSQLRS